MQPDTRRFVVSLASAMLVGALAVLVFVFFGAPPAAWLYGSLAVGMGAFGLVARWERPGRAAEGRRIHRHG